jgi:hypothetical protein
MGEYWSLSVKVSESQGESSEGQSHVVSIIQITLSLAPDLRES